MQNNHLYPLTPFRLTWAARFGAVATSLVIILSLSACSQSDDEKSRDAADQAQAAIDKVEQTHLAKASTAAQPYEVETAKSEQSQATVALGGSISPKTKLTIRAQAPGRVVYIAGDEGTVVKAGDTLIDLDEKSLLAQRRAGQAGLQRARAQLNNAFIQLDQNIISDGHSSRGGMGMPSMFDQFITKNVGDSMGLGNSSYDRYASISASRAAVEQAKAMVMEAESGIEQIDSMFRDKQAIAPADATILEKMVEVGDAVQPGQPMLRIGDTANLEVVVDVPTRLMNGLQTGMALPVTIDNHEPIEAKIVQIFPSANVQRNTVRIKLALPADINATSGMYATVKVPDINRGKLATISVPQKAIIWRGSQASIYVVNSAGKAELRIIRTGGAEGGERTSILSGLSEGDRVVTTPDTLLRSGQLIQTIPAS